MDCGLRNPNTLFFDGETKLMPGGTSCEVLRFWAVKLVAKLKILRMFVIWQNTYLVANFLGCFKLTKMNTCSDKNCSLICIYNLSKGEFSNLLESTLLFQSFVFKVSNLRSSPQTQDFDFELKFDMHSAQWGIIPDFWQIYYYSRSQKLVSMTYCALCRSNLTIWVKNQNPWSKLGLWWRSEVANSKTKKMAQQCTFQKIWKILLWQFGYFE